MTSRVVFDFTCTDGSLPTQGTDGVPTPIPGAVLDFSADLLPLGGTTAMWENIGSGTAEAAFTTVKPDVFDDGPDRYVLFDGVNTAANVNGWTNTVPRTVFMRVMFPVLPTSQLVLWSGIVAGGSPTIGLFPASGGGYQIGMYAGLQLQAGPVIAAGVWYSVVAVFNTNASVFRVGADEVAGNTGARQSNGFRVGGNAAGVFQGPYAVNRVGALGTAADAATRADIIARLNA